jgi:hypothetical protein
MKFVTNTIQTNRNKKLIWEKSFEMRRGTLGRYNFNLMEKMVSNILRKAKFIHYEFVSRKSNTEKMSLG